MDSSHWICTLTSCLVIFAAACGSDPSFDTNVQAEQPVCPDCPDLDVDVTIYKNAGVFDIQIAEFPGFDYEGVTKVDITFSRSSQQETAALPFGPGDIESGINETGLELPGSLDYTVDPGLTAKLVFTKPGTSNTAFSPVALLDGE